MEERINLDSVFLSELSSQFGSAFYLFSEDVFAANLREFQSAFETYYPNVKLGYSYKTNYIPKVCKIAKKHGAYAEVVSGMEYDLALKIGYDGRQIIFNGPLKEKKELYRSFDYDSIIHFDSYKEIELLIKYLKENPDRIVRCALRCNFDIGESNRSRFGFDVNSGEVESVYEELFSLEGCQPIGIHGHFSTKHRSLESYKRRTISLIKLSKKIFKNHHLQYIDIGGGFFGDMPDEVKGLFDYDVPTYEEYGKAVGELMASHFPNKNVSLILEPGASVVANTMKFICQVYSIKKIEDRSIVTLTGGIHNVRPTGSGSDIPFRVIENSEDSIELEDAVIGGYTCMETDLISENFTGRLNVGDFLVFDNMGAYNLVFKPPFIKQTPAVLNHSSNDPEIKVIKKEESIDDLFMTYIF